MSKLKFGMATASAIAAFVGVAGLSLAQVQAGDDVMGIQVSDFGTQRARIEFEVQKQECDTLKNSQPQAYDPCLQKARSTRDNLLTQAGSAPAGQGSQGFGSNQSQQQFSGQEKGTIDRMTSAVKETVAEVKEKLFGSSDQGREGQQQGQGSGQGFAQSQSSQQGFGAGSGQQGQNPAQWQQGQGSGQGFAQSQPSQQGLGTGGQQPQGQSMGQGQQGGGIQGQHPLQQGFDAQQMQGQGSGQGGQSFGQQGVAQGQQGQQGQSGQGSFQGRNYAQQPQGQSGQGSFQGAYSQQPQGQSGQGSFQGGNYGQQQQGQAGQQGTGGTNQQFQSGGTQGLQGQQGGSSGSAGAQGEHMNAAEYYRVLADQQYGTLKQECDTMKQDPSVWEQCQQHAKSVRDKIAGMAEQGT